MKFKVGDYVIPICSCNIGFCKDYFNKVCQIEAIHSNIRVKSLDYGHYEYFTEEMLKSANTTIIRERLGVV